MNALNEYNSAFVGMADEIKDVILKSHEAEDWCNIKYDNNTIKIIIEDDFVLQRTLILNNADCKSPFDFGECIFSIRTLNQSDGKYCISGKLYNCFKDDSQYVSIAFDNPQLETTVFRADCDAFCVSPWAYLTGIAFSIYNKSKISANYLNDKEREIFKLIKEVASINTYWEINEEITDISFDNLKQLSLKFNYDKIEKMLCKLEKSKNNKYTLQANKLIFELNKQKYELLWRYVFKEIQESQEEYPTKCAYNVPSDMLYDTRKSIEKKLNEYGFSGTYPDFVKKSDLKKIHLAESYGMTYFVGCEKNVVYRIHCFEEQINNMYTIQFLTGTALLKKDEKADDIYACTFNRNGKRLFNTVFCTKFITNNDNESDDINMYTKIAVKKAQLQRLNKEEQRYNGNEKIGLTGFLSILLIMGGLFGILMTIGFMLIEFIITIIFADISAFGELFMQTPWWMILLFCWISFGGIMGIITVYTNNK